MFVYSFRAARYVYFGWGASQFYDGPRLSSWLRGMPAAAIIAALFAASAAYEAFARR